jgi:tetratricopeptide (TPR) repeat protein
MPVAGGFLRAQPQRPETQLQPEPAAPQSPSDVIVQAGIAMMAKGNYQGAEEVFLRARQLDPANLRAITGMAEALMKQDKTDLALGLLRAEVENAPKRTDLQLVLGNTAVRAGRYDMAVEVFQKILDGMDKNSKAAGDVYLRIGETYRRKGDQKSAIGSLQRAKEALPGNAIVLNTLAVSLDSDGQTDEATAMYRQSLAADPNNGVTLHNLARLVAQTDGDLNQALTYAQRAKQLLPGLNQVSDTLGWIYLKKNLSDNAIEIFNELVQKEPKNSTYHYHLAMALIQKGDRFAAMTQAKAALNCNPGQAEDEKIQALIESIGK